MADIPQDGMRPGRINKQNFKFKGQETAKPVPQETEEIKKDVDLRNDPAQFLGRSLINSKKFNPAAFKGEVYQNLQKDLEVLKENPELVEKSDKVFEKALSDGKDYEDAAKIQNGFVEEFKK